MVGCGIVGPGSDQGVGRGGVGTTVGGGGGGVVGAIVGRGGGGGIVGATVGAVILQTCKVVSGALEN